MLHFDDRGHRLGTPVLFIHGFLSSNLQWEPNTERLGTELRTVLVEQLGHGRSPAPDDPAAYEPASVLAELESIRDGLGLDRWWIVGHSLGGATAIRYALAHPDRTLGVVFTNSRAVFGIDRADERGTAPERRRSSAQPAAPADLRTLPFHPIHAKRFPADLRRRMVEAADVVPPYVVSHVGASARAWRSSDEFHELTVPMLLVNGTWEKAFQPCVAVARASIPDLRVVDLEGGHSINIEQPEAFEQAVLDFIRAQS